MGKAFEGLNFHNIADAVLLDEQVPALVRAHLYVVVRQVSKYVSPWKLQEVYTASLVDVDDLFQEGVCALLHASDEYDPKKNIPFEHYAARVVHNALRSVGRKVRAITSDDVLLTDLIGDRLEEDYRLEDTKGGYGYENAETTLLLLDFVKTLTPHQKKTLHLLLCGFTPTEVAKHMNTQHTNIQNVILMLKGKALKFARVNNFENWLAYFPQDKQGETNDPIEHQSR